MKPSETSTRRVEFFYDLVCVHSYLGFTRFSKAVDRYRENGGSVEVIFRPFHLSSEEPAAGRPLFEVHRAAFGEERAQAIAKDRSFGAEDGLKVDFERAIFTNTAAAHRLVLAAAAEGKGERMAERLFRAYFSDGVNIADSATLRRLADEIGVVRRDVGEEVLRAQLARVREAKVSSVPLFVYDDGVTMSGAQSVEAFSDVLGSNVLGSDVLDANVLGRPAHSV
ncbi:DsbA family protein [Streptomyces sp. NPDC051561]|uniref:DsbA family protein n=1 Tax=Streptomyces sp. NPDC051561 TaxID=3365658 RepID=UPI0037ACBACB